MRSLPRPAHFSAGYPVGKQQRRGPAHQASEQPPRKMALCNRDETFMRTSDIGRRRRLEIRGICG
jgi:hypothetical protein